MTDYLDIGVVRIQSYLTRAPSLKGRRGASTMVSEATRRLREHPPQGTVVNPDAGEIDGVVSLQLIDATVDRAAAADVLTALRRALPAAELTAALWCGDTYPNARAGTPRWSQDWLPAVPEWPLAKSCDWCRNWPASGTVVQVGGARAQYCSDCRQRHDRAGAATDERPGRQPGPEQELLARLPGARLPDDFAALAALAHGPQDDDTHVVTVYADGNSVGEFMKANGYAPALARTIDDATWAALTETMQTLRIDELLPVIPHLIGGDDVLVSLPAHLAWPAVRALLTRFGAAPAFRKWSSAPTLSAGVVVHHHSEPLSDVIDLAAALLHTAKRHHPGQPTIAWHSITHDGAIPGDRAPLRLDTLNRSWPALTGLAAQPPAARQQLARLLRDGHGGQLAAHIRRLGMDTVVGPFGPDSTELADALGMVRWWQR